MTAHWLFVRGALSFGIAMAIVPSAITYLPFAITYLPFAITYLPAEVLATALLLFVAGLGLSFRTGLGLRPAFGCMLGSVVASVLIWLSLYRPWVAGDFGGDPSLARLLVSNVLAWGCGGAAAGAAIRPRLLLLGMTVFALGGVVAGYTWAYALGPGVSSVVWAATVGWSFAGTVAGGLYGAGIAMLHVRKEDQSGESLASEV